MRKLHYKYFHLFRDNTGEFIICSLSKEEPNPFRKCINFPLSNDSLKYVAVYEERNMKDDFIEELQDWERVNPRIKTLKVIQNRINLAYYFNDAIEMQFEGYTLIKPKHIHYTESVFTNNNSSK